MSQCYWYLGSGVKIFSDQNSAFHVSNLFHFRSTNPNEAISSIMGLQFHVHQISHTDGSCARYIGIPGGSHHSMSVLLPEKQQVFFLSDRTILIGLWIKVNKYIADSSPQIDRFDIYAPFGVVTDFSKTFREKFPFDRLDENDFWPWFASSLLLWR